MQPIPPVVAVAVLTLAFVGPGCAAPARAEAMVPADYVVLHRHQKSVAVSTGGGQETSGWGYSYIGNDALAAAIHDALLRSGVFASVVHGDDADFRLHVELVSESAPAAGFETTFHLTAHWTLQDKAGAKVLDADITSQNTASVSDAFVGVKRLQLQKEGAACANIRLGIERLSQLTL
jgi:hypothetical protein